MTCSKSEEDKLFREWVESLPDEHWAKYDLSACRLGWDAGRKALQDETFSILGISKTCEHGKGMNDYCLPCGRIHKA